MSRLAILILTVVPLSARAASTGELELRVVDADSREPVAVRMHLKDQRGRPVKVRDVPFWKDHFVFDGQIVLELRPGLYTFELERGPEYRVRTGNFMIKRGDTDTKEVEMQRFTHLAKEGWWSGDLHIHRDPQDIELLMRAEDLHIGPVITWWNDRNRWDKEKRPAETLVKFDNNRFYHLMAGEDEREGGALLYFNLNDPLPISGADREFPSPADFLKMAQRDELVHVDIEKPFWWDVPVWLASGMADSIGVANNHMWRGGGLINEAWGRPRDKLLYPDPDGNGRWTQDIYYHALNCGLRLPPSAGSASGVLPNPVGYNRVYVHCGEELSWDAWWKGLRAGQVVVTNGPLIRNPRANGQLPGHLFRAEEGESVELQIQLNLSLRDRVEYLEVVRDGEVVEQVRLDKLAMNRGRLPKIEFDESGWVLVRAVASTSDTYRFAATGPFYVEIGDRPRISKRSAQFFLDWVYERARRVQIADADQREKVIRYHRAARNFWQKMVDKANAE